MWDENDGQVVCRQLGFGGVVSVSRNARFGEGEGEIWLDDVDCKGDELELRQCAARAWGQENCHHGEDAGVTCDTAQPAFASES